MSITHELRLDGREMSDYISPHACPQVPTSHHDHSLHHHHSQVPNQGPTLTMSAAFQPTPEQIAYITEQRVKEHFVADRLAGFGPFMLGWVHD